MNITVLCTLLITNTYATNITLLCNSLNYIQRCRAPLIFVENTHKPTKDA